MGAQSDRAEELSDRVNGHPEHVEDALPELAAIIERPEDTAALVVAIEALGLAWDPRAVALLLRHVPPDHSDGEVRFALARCLHCGVDEDDPSFEPVVRVLVTMSSDPEDQVRDWACFGLGQLEADTPAVRAALVARLEDPFPDARCEALVALADLGDEWALAACRRALDVDPDDVYLLELRAAAAIADWSLLPLLMRLSGLWNDDDDLSRALAAAIVRCTPATASR